MIAHFDMYSKKIIQESRVCNYEGEHVKKFAAMVVYVIFIFVMHHCSQSVIRRPYARCLILSQEFDDLRAEVPVL